MQIWARRLNISSHDDPLDHIFAEFDGDGDGYLDAEDVTAALSSRNVKISPEQARVFLEGVVCCCRCSSNTHACMCATQVWSAAAVSALLPMHAYLQLS